MNMLDQLLSKLENPERPLLGPNYKALKFLGILLPLNLKKKYLYCFMHSAFIIFVVTQWIEAYFLKSDMTLLLNNLKLTLLTTMCIAKVMTFLYWQEYWEEIIDYVTKNDLVQRKSTDSKKINIIKKYTKNSRATTYICWSLVFTVTLGDNLFPLLKYILSSSYRANTSNGTEKYVEIVSSWVPYDKNTLIGYISALVFQFTFSLYGATLHILYDTNAMVILKFFSGELEMLRIDSSKIFGDETESITDAVSVNRLKDCHKRHREIIKYSKLLDSCLSPTMFLYMLLYSVLLCTNAYQIMFATSALYKIAELLFLAFSISHLFIYCWHSHDIMYASQDLMLGPYESCWWKMDVKRRKDVYILTEQFKTIIVFSIGPFAYLTLPTFINVLKGAYSYYTLLSNSQMN